MIMSYLAVKPRQIVESANQRIARELEQARFSIWIANVWFTDKKLIDLLIKKVREGLNVEIILNKNKSLGCREQAKLQEFIDAGGEFYLMNETDGNRMLDKGFCMLDYSTIIDDEFEDRTHLEPGFSTYFLREYPEALVEHYINQYLSVKNNFCINRYG